ncbi:MAG: glutamine--fructose-6-phosphate transaminase (isomerizing) [Gammaproteobacteria bacterium]|nr:MAG: glutamine--fructose-6-phosphate transaminase (isomerizing) [Gammaproteobacteria bacterium]
MCGIVAAIAQRDVDLILLEGLRRLEYRGYDSAGMAVLDDGRINRLRSVGKVAALQALNREKRLTGQVGIAHTRWATHGEPSERNAHPHICNERIAVVHNGIIENHESLREQQKAEGFRFTSDTDTEVIAHQIWKYVDQGMPLEEAVAAATRDVHGAWAIAVIDREQPDRLVAARQGSPLVIGIGLGEHFLASDVQALLPVTQRFVYPENGDLVILERERMEIRNAQGEVVERPEVRSEQSADEASKGGYRHYMLKEIHEQPRAISDTLEGRIVNNRIPDAILGPEATTILDRIRHVQIVACGTSYHAGMVARYWFEELAGIPCAVEVASEFRYRKHVVPEGSLFVTISQSGETADTLAALMLAREIGFEASLSICNVPESSLVRESDLALMTRAGPEIGVASTKAFTTQLAALMMLVIALGRRHGMGSETEERLCRDLLSLPGLIEQVLESDEPTRAFAEQIAEREHALFLGRGAQYPVAMEGALKLKEISYIHAEAYPAGELKHGPLALVDAEMPVIAVAPDDALLEKLKSNLQEVRARGGELYVYAEEGASMDEEEEGLHLIRVPPAPASVAPIVYTVPLQLLAYHAAVMKGTDVDQPRNLAKSVTVE